MLLGHKQFPPVPRSFQTLTELLKVGLKINLMGSELCPIQSTQGILHVFPSKEFHHSFTVPLDISKTYVSCLPHVIFEVLPTASRRKTCKRKNRIQTPKTEPGKQEFSPLEMQRYTVLVVLKYQICHVSLGQHNSLWLEH